MIVEFRKYRRRIANNRKANEVMSFLQSDADRPLPQRKAKGKNGFKGAIEISDSLLTLDEFGSNSSFA